MTESYANNAKVKSVERLMHAGTQIVLNDEQKVRLRISLNTSQQYALQQIENQKRAQQELDACDAIATITGISDPPVPRHPKGRLAPR